jgi:predicted transcriptional regulator
MGTRDKIIIISMLAVAIAIFLFLVYQFTAFYHYKSIVLDRFPVEPPEKESKRYFEEEMERKEQAIELAKKYTRGNPDLYGSIQNLSEKIKGDIKLIGWKAEKAIHAGQAYDLEKHGSKVMEDFKESMQKIKKGLIKLKDLGFLADGSPASELLIENDPKYFSQRIKRLKEEFVSIQFYLLPRGKGMIKAKDLSEEAKRVIDEIDKEIDKISSIMKYFYHYIDSLYFVSYLYQTEEDRIKDRKRGWYFEVDLDSKTVRDIALDPELSRKYKGSIQ